MRRLTLEELFRVGPQGLTEISDETLELRLTAEEQRAMRHIEFGRSSVPRRHQA